MTAKRLLVILGFSTLLAIALEFIAIETYRGEAKRISSMMCDVVAARAQAGSTRDVYDQVFSFLRRHSPDSKAQVLVKRAGKEFGANTSDDGISKFEEVCHIENAPDYQIVMRFDRHKLISASLAETFGLILFAVLSLAWAGQTLLRGIRELWFNQVLLAIRSEIGLSNGSDAFASKGLGHVLSKLFLSSLEGLKEPIEKLKNEIRLQQQSLSEQEKLIDRFQAEKNRADHFAQSVKQVHHDLKGPMSALKIYLSDDSRADESIASILRTIEKIGSDLETKRRSGEPDGGVTLEVAEVAILDAVTTSRQALAAKYKAQIDFRYDKNQLSPISVEPNHFRRVLLNILQNSAEALSGSGIGRIQVSCQRDGNKLLISVEDNGKGITKDTIPKLFERGATFEKVGGSGLGLVFAKNCVEEWGGSISIQSELGKGTTVEIRLPIEECYGKFIGQIGQQPEAELVVLDDEIDLQKAIWSKRSKFFSTPHEFMDWFDSNNQKTNSQLVIDLHMHDLVSGLDVIRTIGKRPEVYLSTSDYLNAEAMEVSATYGVPIMPKQLLFAKKEMEI